MQSVEALDQRDARGAGPAPRPGPRAARAGRAAVLRAVLARGPVAASTLAGVLGVTPAAVRRHLDALEAVGAVAPAGARAAGTRAAGRPARRWVATAAGQEMASTRYDGLAVAALQALADEAGGGAVARFAAARARELEERHGPAVRAGSVRERVEALADSLTGDGYAARAVPVRGSVQLCQGHCPVHAVAARFPQLCDAETEALSRVLGAPVRRLATIAAGSHACTTHVSSPRPSGPVALAPPPHRPATPSPRTTTPVSGAGMEQA